MEYAILITAPKRESVDVKNGSKILEMKSYSDLRKSLNLRKYVSSYTISTPPLAWQAIISPPPQILARPPVKNILSVPTMAVIAAVHAPMARKASDQMCHEKVIRETTPDTAFRSPVKNLYEARCRIIFHRKAGAPAKSLTTAQNTIHRIDVRLLSMKVSVHLILIK
ncbi:hypothetical protein GcC1_217003 [Golovinomyces cichoracearum]|uniref:Uncharacterized protein n=1 Tax=Golovinomyces cichoracearum TaxID=62708 RepID=A0A420H8P6_9PEZI|nr:hypothetical protein GcC1_217003 [Golovinomyces cichoracearum]